MSARVKREDSPHPLYVGEIENKAARKFPLRGIFGSRSNFIRRPSYKKIIQLLVLKHIALVGLQRVRLC